MAYDDYYNKHWARYSGWLPASKAFKDQSEKDNLKYLTLCDIEALDIFMLEKAGILSRDVNKFLTDVIICEGEASKVPKIFEVTRPPLREAIIQGKLEKLLLFEDDATTQDVNPDEDVRSLKLREKLQTKKHSERLMSAFPFDIINFDPYGNLLDSNKDILKAFNKIFELQIGIDSFLMFVTTPINHFDEIKSQFKADFDRNILTYEAIKDCARQFLSSEDFRQLETGKQAAIGLGKTIISKYSKSYGWKNKHHGIFVYENRDGRHMMSSVIEFTKTSPTEGEEWYIEDIIQIIKTMPEFRTYAESQVDEVIKNDLEEIIRHREDLQKEFNI